MLNLPARFQEKIIPEPNSGCWIWLGFIRPDGYGAVYYGGRSTYVHRVMYEMLVGKIEDGKQLDHLCRLRCCVNPEHLEPVTKRENVLRGIGPTAINFKRTHCKHGHEFTHENTYINFQGNRQCRACHRSFVYDKKKRAAARRRYYLKSGR